MASLVESQGYAGDEGNFEDLYSTYRSDVHRLASYLLRNASDAEDASQTVFLNVLRALRQGVRPADPRAWLLAITRNVCFSRRRAVARRPDEVELDLERAPGPHDSNAPTAEDIVGALSRMRPNQRTALILRDFRGAPRSEIGELLSLSPTGVETLLTRARTSFREEIQAGEQPFDCAETKALVEQQLAGLITVAGRHSLRTHLRHCAPCSTLARAVRSSRGKLATLIFWPGELISRLASALSQAPTVAHVAAAVTSTAAIATVAIPFAVTDSSPASHVEGRTAPAPAVAAATASSPSYAASPFTSRAAIVRAHTHVAAAHRARVAAKHATAKTHAAARTAAARAASGATASGGTPATAAPVASSPVQASPPAAAPAPVVMQPVAVPPRSPSPAVRPSTKPRAKPKPAVKPRRRSGGRHPTDPADVMPVSGSPGSSLAAPGTGAPSTAGPGQTVSSAGASSSATQPSGSSSSSSQDSSGNNSGGTTTGGSSGSSGSAGSGSGHGHKHKH